MSCSPNALPHGPCLLFVDGRSMPVRRADSRPDRPHPLLHAYYDDAPAAKVARRNGPPR